MFDSKESRKLALETLHGIRPALEAILADVEAAGTNDTLRAADALRQLISRLDGTEKKPALDS